MTSAEQSKTMKEFIDIAAVIQNPRVVDWKNQGGRVVGYFYSFFSQEIVMAAGIQPFRIRGTGSTGTELSDSYFSEICCSFPRHCFNQALKGEYDFLDGLVVTGNCDHLRHVYENWQNADIGTSFLHLFFRPSKRGENMAKLYEDNLRILIKELEAHFKVEITPERINKAIRLSNRTRGLQRELYELRKTENPPITGAETVSVMVAETAMPKELYNEKLENLLAELSAKEPSAGNGNSVRLMIIGACNDDPYLSSLVEESGGIVVTDETGCGSRNIFTDIDENSDDPVALLADYYVNQRPSCPRIAGDHQRRAEGIIEKAKAFNVDGIIGEALISCDMYASEYFMLKPKLKAAGIPFMKLDKEYVPSFTGQLRTRVQAFIETLV
jgi:benzoyl-CoA reductase subunit C